MVSCIYQYAIVRKMCLTPNSRIDENASRREKLRFSADKSLTKVPCEQSLHGGARIFFFSFQRFAGTFYFLPRRLAATQEKVWLTSDTFCNRGMYIHSPKVSFLSCKSCSYTKNMECNFQTNQQIGLAKLTNGKIPTEFPFSLSLSCNAKLLTIRCPSR